MQEWGGAAAHKGAVKMSADGVAYLTETGNTECTWSRDQLIISMGSRGKYCMFQILVVIYLAGISLSYLPVLEQSALAL